MSGTFADVPSSDASRGTGDARPAGADGTAARRGLLDHLGAFLSGHELPVFALSLLLLYEVALAVLLFAPPAPSGLGAFAEDFRIWCLGSDPATGRMSPLAALGMASPPLFVAALLLVMWWGPVRWAIAKPWRSARAFLLALLCTGAGFTCFVLYGPRPANGELPFPAESLRTSYPAPVVRLTDQAGAPVDLAAMRGHVVLLTAIYSRCPSACPLLLAEVDRVLRKLDPREAASLRVVAVTLDPGNDTPAVLAQMALSRGMMRPRWHLLGGAPAEVERTLDRMGVARKRNAETGLISHESVYLLIDRRGRLAYRLAPGARQEHWLATALTLLLREGADVD